MLPIVPAYAAPQHFLPPNLQEGDDLEPPDLQAWIDYLNEGGNPNAERFGIPMLSGIIIALGCDCYNEQSAKFFELFDLLLSQGADPNVVQERFQINNNILINVTPMHMIYLI